MNPDASELFTWESLVTLQGSALACYLVANVLGKLIPPLPDVGRAWIAFLLALGIQIALTLSSEDPTAQTWIVAILNGFLIAASALGLNQVTTPSGDGGGGGGGGEDEEEGGGDGGGTPNHDTFRVSWWQ